MTLLVVVRLEAQAELVEAWGWYETQRSGLGDELLGCLDAAIGRAARDPTLHALVAGDVLAARGASAEAYARYHIAQRRHARYGIKLFLPRM